ncbi:MAG: 30S ribosomal protein S8e [Euryarchaeota archaeon]|nr:30S ribosomal protein S8e [Euryarchaeota archaeon]
MALWQGTSVRKPTGGRLRPAHKKRAFEIGREVTLPPMGPEEHRIIRTQGGNTKVRILSSNVINVTDPATGKTQKIEFQTVAANPANPHYVRRNIITRGAVVVTKLGKARITSRPGQDGCLNGILVK